MTKQQPPPLGGGSRPTVRVAFAVSGTSAADVTPQQRTSIAQAVAGAAGVQASAATVSVQAVQFGTDQYAPASAYSTLATKVLVYCDLQLTSADDARRVRRGHRDGGIGDMMMMTTSRRPVRGSVAREEKGRKREGQQNIL